MKKYIVLSLLLVIFAVLSAGCGAPARQTELEKINEKAVDFNIKGIESVRNNEYDKAFLYFNRSLELNLRADNQRGTIINLLNIGRLYMLVGQYDEAGKVVLKAYNTGKKINDPTLLSEIYGTLGKYYYYMKNYQESIMMLKSGIEIDRKYRLNMAAGKFNVLAMNYIAMGGSFKDAEISIREAINEGKKYGMETDIADSLRLTGDVAYLENSFDRAEKMYMSALGIDKRIAINKVSTDMCSLGRLYMQSSPSKAIDMFMQAYEIDISRHNDYDRLRDIEYLIEGYTAINDIDKVTSYQKEKEAILTKMQNNR